VKEVSEWEDETIEGNEIRKSEGVARRFKPRNIYINIGGAGRPVLPFPELLLSSEQSMISSLCLHLTNVLNYVPV
jgi:hypothetical protein